MSIVALEAGITGTPVLLTDVCGFHELEEIGGGISVKPNSKDILDGLTALVADPESARIRGMRLMEFVLNNYTWDSIIDKYISLFETI